MENRRVDKLVEKFIENQKPTNDELVNKILQWHNGTVEEKAWQKLIMQNPTTKNLMSIIFNISKRQPEAWEIMKKIDPEEKQLIKIVEQMPFEPMRTEAGEILMNKYSTDKNLRIIIEWMHNGPNRTKAAHKLMEQNPSEKNLKWIQSCASYPSDLINEVRKLAKEKNIKI